MIKETNELSIDYLAKVLSAVLSTSDTEVVVKAIKKENVK